MLLGVLGDFNDRLKSRRILNRDFAKHFTVERHASFYKTGDELGIADAFRSGGCR